MRPLSDEIQASLRGRDLLEIGQLIHAVLALQADLRRHLEDDKKISGFEVAATAFANFATIRDAVVGLQDIPGELKKLSAADVEYLADLFFDPATAELSARRRETVDRAVEWVIATVHFIDWQLHPAPRARIVYDGPDQTETQAALNDPAHPRHAEVAAHYERTHQLPP
jgi:hypothetical protein